MREDSLEDRCNNGLRDERPNGIVHEHRPHGWGQGADPVGHGRLSARPSRYHVCLGTVLGQKRTGGGLLPDRDHHHGDIDCGVPVERTQCLHQHRSASEAAELLRRRACLRHPRPGPACGQHHAHARAGRRTRIRRASRVPYPVAHLYNTSIASPNEKRRYSSRIAVSYASTSNS